MRNQNESLKIQNLVPEDRGVWIGLFRDSRKWWGKFSFRYWNEGQPNNNKGIQSWVVARAKRASTSHVWLGLPHTCTVDLCFWVSREGTGYHNWDPGTWVPQGGLWENRCGPVWKRSPVVVINSLTSFNNNNNNNKVLEKRGNSPHPLP